MQSVHTITTTFVSLKPPDHSSRLVSENLLAQDKSTAVNEQKMQDLREEFLDVKTDLVCLGKLVANPHRDQDNLILELMLPEDLNVEVNSSEAARLLAPFLLVSDHIVFNL